MQVIELQQDLLSTAQGQAALRRVVHKAHRDQAASVMREKSLQVWSPAPEMICKV